MADEGNVHSWVMNARATHSVTTFQLIILKAQQIVTDERCIV